ncbi:hypothetical protein [Saccharothrix obliqua]|uniref:hypothetical protein n=1 Tax=Saccharothrix obliqua TaxID=2861747 RepID=UPI001C5DE4DB|nr:hypothetical protein [Saccharothrix obliqua]MBW4716428.1 hypothetical protein [Saccharothrix obliqua]
MRTSLADAATALARHVLDALDGVGEVGLADCVDSRSDATAVLGAARLIGADLFAPQVLLGRALDPRDAESVIDSFAVFPPVIEPVTPEQRVRAWRDWATARLLARLVGTAEPAVPVDNTPLDAHDDWPRWSVRAAQLSSLALPGVGGPVVEAVRCGRQALARGVTRALLRRDHVTAARLARWAALLAGTGVEVPLDLALLLEHIRLHGGAGPRMLLDLAIARHVLGPRAA